MDAISERTPSTAGTPFYGCAYGLRLSVPHPLETLSDCATAGGLRPVSWTRVADRDALAQEWSGVGVEQLVGSGEEPKRGMSIQVDSRGAHLIEAPRHGAHVVSADGLRIVSLLDPGAPWDWQRLFVAQPLPLTATIRGLEPIHASAVSFAGRAIAISAPSGTGKTSLAMHLVARGALLLTDDVLTVEPTAAGLRAYPGARLLSAQVHELATLSPTERSRLGNALDTGEKVYLNPHLDPEPRYLAALYRLVRSSDAGELRIVEELPADPREVLATTFLTYVKSRERLVRHLEFAACLAQHTRVFVVHLPWNLSAPPTAALLEQHVQDVVGLTTRT